MKREMQQLLILQLSPYLCTLLREISYPANANNVTKATAHISQAQCLL